MRFTLCGNGKEQKGRRERCDVCGVSRYSDGYIRLAFHELGLDESHTPIPTSEANNAIPRAILAFAGALAALPPGFRHTASSGPRGNPVRRHRPATLWLSGGRGGTNGAGDTSCYGLDLSAVFF